MRTPARPAHPLRPAVAALVIGTALVAVSGCSVGGSASSEDAGGSAASTAAPPAPAPAVGDSSTRAGSAEPATDGSAETGGSMAVAAAAKDRKLTRRADISLTVPDVDTAAARVRAVAASAEGLVVAEAISSEPDDPALGGFSSITISVPADRLDTTLDRLARLGTVRSRHTSTEDVTGQYVDTASRVKTMQASVQRVRALMSRATRLGDVVALEGELSRRQAELEATQAQLVALRDAVAMSPVEVQLGTDEQALEQAGDSGFLAGLGAGWRAFTDSVTVLLTALGALLPFAVVLALVLTPLLLWWRRRSPRAGAAVQPAVQPPPAA
jgi:hypothetical protein